MFNKTRIIIIKEQTQLKSQNMSKNIKNKY